MSANLTQQQQTDKRYVVTVSFYMHAENDKAAVQAASKFTRELNSKDDCKATVDSLTESKFGTIGPGRKII